MTAGFSHKDDYWALMDKEGEPMVWLYPRVGQGRRTTITVGRGEVPFDLFQVHFSVLRNSAASLPPFLDAVESLAKAASEEPTYPARGNAFVSREVLKRDVEALQDAWTAAGIKPGSRQALAVDH